MTATMSITELQAHVERKFSGAYRCKAVLTAWDTKTETATYLLTFSVGSGKHVANLDTTIYAQAVVGSIGTRGAATSSHPFTSRSRWQVPITTD